MLFRSRRYRQKRGCHAVSCCKRSKTTVHSLTRDAKQRRENVAGVYAMCGQTDVSGLRILLVDDVVTTGAKMSEAARILRKAGAKAVYGAALARHED